MDDLNFDAFARAIGAGASRRQALRLLAAGALAGFLPRRGRAALAAQDAGCAPGLTYCEEQPGWAPAGCYDLATDYLHCGSCMHQCPSAGPVEMTCIGGECVVTGCGDSTDCTGNLDCTDLGWDPNNCGACGNVCDSGICEAGACTQVGCEPGLAYCPFDEYLGPAGCYDLASDRDHCGSCDRPCPNWVTCIAGECVAPPCDGGLYRCGIDECVDLQFDPYNCGLCDNVCDSGLCQGGVCAAVGCEPGLTLCGESAEFSYCTDLTKDYSNCGACGVECPFSGPDGFRYECVGGTCLEAGCELGLSYCTEVGACVDLGYDPNHCGACGNVCTSGVCEAEVCAPEETTCAAGLTSCPARSDGQPAGCYDLASDYWHCGTCDLSCPTAGFHGTCRGGQCVEVSCGEGLAYCTAQANGQQPGCYDLSSDRFHCGACDVQCPTTVGCYAGECGLPPCDGGLARCAAGCVDLGSDPNHCGACGYACDSGVCEAEVCTPTTTRAITDGPTPTTTPAEDEAATEQEAAAPTGSSDADRPTRTPRTRDTAPEPAAQGAAPAAPESVLTWPFAPDAGQWTIINGYRGEDEHAPRADSRRNASLFALDFAVCRPEDVDAADGTCALGSASGSAGGDGDDPVWDREATRGATVLSPVDGTVAWTEASNPTCRSFAIDITGHPGYRLALFNVDEHPRRGRPVKQGTPIGTVAEGGCELGDHLHMVLYKPQAGAADDPVAGREGVPFAGDWAIDGCDYPDDKRTGNQYRGVLVPCTSEDDTSASS